MEILLLCGIYAVEFMCYRIGLQILFNKSVKCDKWFLVGFIITVLLGSSSVYVLGKLTILTMFVLTAMVIGLKGKIKERIFEVILVLVLVSCIDDILETIGIKLGTINESYLLVRCITFLILMVICGISKRIYISNKAHISFFAYFVIALVAVSMLTGLAFLDYIMHFIKNRGLNSIFAVLDVVVYINVILLVIYIVSIKKTNMRIEELLKTEKILKDMQVDYYHRLLEKEMETKKYRHDMNNHFYYIQTLLDDDKMKEAKAYFYKLQGNFHSVQNMYYATGNEMIDVIMNYFFKVLPKETKVEILGRCPVKLMVEEVDLCTIFSNVFQNVAEAVVTLEINNREVKIFINKGKAYVEYIIANTFFEKDFERCKGNDIIPATHKADKKNHGIGLRNVKDAVERNGGKFSWKTKDGWFYIKIILPIVTV